MRFQSSFFDLFEFFTIHVMIICHFCQQLETIDTSIRQEHNKKTPDLSNSKVRRLQVMQYYNVGYFLDNVKTDHFRSYRSPLYYDFYENQNWNRVVVSGLRKTFNTIRPISFTGPRAPFLAHPVPDYFLDQRPSEPVPRTPLLDLFLSLGS